MTVSHLPPSLTYTHHHLQVSGAALKGPQALLSGKLTAVGKGDSQSHKNTCTYKCTRPTYTD